MVAPMQEDMIREAMKTKQKVPKLGHCPNGGGGGGGGGGSDRRGRTRPSGRKVTLCLRMTAYTLSISCFKIIKQCLIG